MVLTGLQYVCLIHRNDLSTDLDLGPRSVEELDVTVDFLGLKSVLLGVMLHFYKTAGGKSCH